MAEINGLDIQLTPKLPVVPALAIVLVPSFPICAGIELHVRNEEHIEGNFMLFVKDKLGNPIENAKIDILNNSKGTTITLYSDEFGYIETRLEDLNEFILTISKNNKQYYKHIFEMDFEINGRYLWEISLSSENQTFISNDGNLYINTNPSNPENKLIIK